MLVTSGIKNTINYFCEITEKFDKLPSQFKVIIAFSGEYKYKDKICTEPKYVNKKSVGIRIVAPPINLTYAL